MAGIEPGDFITEYNGTKVEDCHAPEDLPPFNAIILGTLPQTKVTASRRGDQYKALCNPGKDGKGQPCGIDDCAGPGAIACIDGACKAAPKDGGMTQ